MPTKLPEKIEFLTLEVQGLQARMQGKFNQAQSSKLNMLEAIRTDYVLSLEKAREKEKRDAV